MRNEHLHTPKGWDVAETSNEDHTPACPCPACVAERESRN